MTLLARDIVDGDDVGMIERRGCFGFLNEASFAIGICDLFRRKYLDGYEAIQMLIACLVDNAHPSFAETRENLVMHNVPTRQ